MGGLVHQDLPDELHGLLQDGFERCAHNQGRAAFSCDTAPLQRQQSTSCEDRWARTGGLRTW